MTRGSALPLAGVVVLGLGGFTGCGREPAAPVDPPLFAVTFEVATGEGFVGKGNVQATYGWNNALLQTCAPIDEPNCVEFRAQTETETTWQCRNSNNQNIQERTRITTVSGVFDDTSREPRNQNQVTGFILVGYNGDATSEAEGPPLESCPSGPWSLVAGSTVTVQLGLTGMAVRDLRISPETWVPLAMD